jgi:Tfp pilus assembly protein PilF
MLTMKRIIVPALLLAAVVGCRSTAQSKSSGTTIVADGSRDTATARRENEAAFELIQQGRLDEAEKACKRAIAADIMYGPAHNNLGLVYYHQDKLYAAAWEFQNAAKLMPYQPEPRNNLGLVFERAGKIANAAEAYAQARGMQPDNPHYIGNLARAHVRKGDTDEQTRALLEEVVLKDDRPEWRGWARQNLYRMRPPSAEDATTRPKASP